MSNKLKAAIDPIAGEFKWYMAGGGAAWWHIIGHMTFWHGAHDWQYFESVQKQIFPHDIEGNSVVGVVTTFPGKSGCMDVSLTKMKQQQFDEIVETHCVKVDGILVYKPESIIRRYKTASDPSKKAKRDLRSAMLALVDAGQPITQEGVERNMPRAPNLMAQFALGRSKLKHVGRNDE